MQVRFGVCLVAKGKHSLKRCQLAVNGNVGRVLRLALVNVLGQVASSELCRPHSTEERCEVHPPAGLAIIQRFVAVDLVIAEAIFPQFLRLHSSPIKPPRKPARRKS